MFKETFMKKITAILCAILCAAASLWGAACDSREKVIIYTSTEDYNVELMQQRLNEKFPDYKIVIDTSKGTSEIASIILAEGEKSDCDIVYAEEYGYLEKMIAAGVLDSIKGDYDLTKYVEDTVPATVNEYVLPAIRTGGAVIINKDILSANGIAKPTSYNDLLDPAYRVSDTKKLISMASPKASGTGYMFYYSLVKAWGETEALNYFDSLTPNVLKYESSGSNPVKNLKAGEVAVGFGMISQAVNEINSGNTALEILIFEEGAPYNLYGNAIVKGKKVRKAVKDVMDYLDAEYTDESNKAFYPEPVLKGKNYEIANFPTNIVYADMSGNNLTAKEELLAKWTH